MLQKLIRSKSFWPTVVTLLAIVILVLLPNRYENPTYRRYERCRAMVLSVDDSLLRQAGLITYGEQICRVELLSGAQKGQVSDAINLMSGSLEVDKRFKPGETILVLVAATENDGIYKVTAVDHYRMNWELLIVVAFILFLVVYAGWIGVRAVLAFLFTVLCIWRILIPCLLDGISPIPLGAAITSVLTIVIIMLVYGLDKRTLAAVAGSLMGTLVTSVLAMIFVRVLNIHGAVMSYSESLLYSGYQHLNLTEIFIASIYIASSGALMDIAVDITSGVHEVVTVDPTVSRGYAIRAGMNIGRAALGTMTTTLLLAYSGSYIGLLMVFVAQGTPLVNILNLNYVSAEIVNTMIGSFGLMTAAPFTAIASGILLTARSKQKAAQQISETQNTACNPGIGTEVR